VNDTRVVNRNASHCSLRTPITKRASRNPNTLPLRASFPEQGFLSRAKQKPAVFHAPVRFAHVRRFYLRQIVHACLEKKRCQSFATRMSKQSGVIGPPHCCRVVQVGYSGHMGRSLPIWASSRSGGFGVGNTNLRHPRFGAPVPLTRPRTTSRPRLTRSARLGSKSSQSRLEKPAEAPVSVSCSGGNTRTGPSVRG
jgi:hypothetical protein